MKRPLYRHIASRLQAMENCQQANNLEWLGRHGDVLEKLCRDYLPRGSGIDAGTTLDNISHAGRLVFNTSYHHMNEHGYYDGWTEHTVIVTPSLLNEFDLRITGRDRNDIKDYLYDVFAEVLMQEIDDAGIVAAA